MLSGDNGILTKTTEAKNRNDAEQIKERIKLAYHSALAGEQGSYTKESLEKELIKEFRDEYEGIDDSNDINWILKAKGQSVTIPAGKIEPVLAKEKLIINENGSTDAEISPYIKYNGNLYRVLYDSAYDEGNGTNYGIEIVSISPIDLVTLGPNDPIIIESSEYVGNPGELGTAERAKWSYNNAIATLNKKAQSYITDLAERARCIGSNPNNPLSEGGQYSENPDFKDKDTNWQDNDRNQLEVIGARKFSDTSVSTSYWVASRYIGNYVGYPQFQMYLVSYDQRGMQSRWSLYQSNADGTPNLNGGGTAGFRVVIKLKSNVIILKGKGTLDEPYELGL